MRMQSSILFVFLLTLCVQSIVIAENSTKPGSTGSADVHVTAEAKPGTADKSAADTPVSPEAKAGTADKGSAAAETGVHSGNTDKSLVNTDSSADLKTGNAGKAAAAETVAPKPSASSAAQSAQPASAQRKKAAGAAQASKKPEAKQPQEANTMSGFVLEAGDSNEGGAGSGRDPGFESEMLPQNTAEHKRETSEFPNAAHGGNAQRSTESTPPVPPALNQNLPASGATFPEIVVILLIAAVALLFVLLIATIIVVNRTTAKAFKEIQELRKKLADFEKVLKVLYQSRAGRQERPVSRTGSSSAVLDGGAFVSASPLQKTVYPPAAAEKSLLDTISPLYSSLAEREKRWEEAGNDVFLDIAQNVFVRIQRGERLSTSSVFLEKAGTWRNSQFVLIGQQLYFNFYLYNEKKELAPDSPHMERILMEMYDIQGSLPGAIQRCLPAQVVFSKNGYALTGKGMVVIS